MSTKSTQDRIHFSYKFDSGDNPYKKVILYDSNGNEIAVGGGTQYSEGAEAAIITGTAILWEDTSDILRVPSAAKPLPVKVISGGGAGEQYADNTVVDAAYKGNIILGTDGINYQVIATDSDGNVQADILTMPTVAVTGTFWQATQPVSAAALPLPAGAATSALQLPDGHNVTVGNTGGAAAVNIQDGGNVITVDGTVIANLSDVDNAVLDTIDAVLDTISGKITACNTGAVVVASGAITETNSGAIKTAVELIDNYYPDVAHDAADSGNPLKVGHKAVLFDSSAPPNAAVAEGDRVNSIADEYGRQYVETTHPNYWDVSADYAAAQTNTSVKAAPGAGLSLYITDVIISNGATAGNITLLDGSGGTVLLEDYPAINGGLTHSFRSPIKLTANTALCVTSTTCTTHSVTVAGFIAP